MAQNIQRLNRQNIRLNGKDCQHYFALDNAVINLMREQQRLEMLLQGIAVQIEAIGSAKAAWLQARGIPNDSTVDFKIDPETGLVQFRETPPDSARPVLPINADGVVEVNGSPE